VDLVGEAVERTDVLPPVRVLLVDDRHERRGLMRLIIESGTHGRTVVAQTESAAGAVAALDRSAIDAAVVEIQIPTDEGVAAVAALRAARPDLVIVVCSFRADAATRGRAIAAGADSYLVKPVSAREIQAACRRTSGGGRPGGRQHRTPQMASS
jgi:DNA-binding NarL/FixJ family response regulator